MEIFLIITFFIILASLIGSFAPDMIHERLHMVVLILAIGLIVFTKIHIESNYTHNEVLVSYNVDINETEYKVYQLRHLKD